MSVEIRAKEGEMVFHTPAGEMLRLGNNGDIYVKVDALREFLLEGVRSATNVSYPLTPEVKEIPVLKSTRVYGCSDDLVEFDGGVHGEVSCYGTDDRDHGVLLVFSDGTILEAKYGKGQRAIWGIMLHKTGSLFDRVDACDDEDAKIHSDVAHFKPGLKWAYAAKEWEVVR